MKIIIGRPDGLGNRLEQVARASAVATATQHQAIYVWNLSTRWDRNYLPLLSAPIQILLTPIPLRPTKLTSTISTQAFLKASKQIRLKFTTTSPVQSDAVVHLRGTDRVIPNGGKTLHPHFMSPHMQNAVLKRCFNLCTERFRVVSIIGDDSGEVKKFGQALMRAGITVVDGAAKTPWQALRQLAAASQIVMASRFSSFALMGAAIGLGQLWVPHETRECDLERYGQREAARF